MTRVAAVDCGTNSLRLLVADVDPAAGTMVELTRRMEIVRLGEGVDRTGRLSEAALGRAPSRCATSTPRTIADLGADRVRFVATSASRDAENRDVFVAGVLERLGVAPEVVAGDEEARLSFDGATREVMGRAAPPFLVVDIGGGSTELVLGERTPGAALSVDIGCVRITERHLRSDPPTLDEVAAARRDVEAMIDEVARVVPLAEARTVVGVAGSVTTVAAISLGLLEYDADAIHLSRIPRADVHAVCDRLLGMSRSQRAALPAVHPGRVDVIGGGAVILDAVLARVAGLTGIDHLVVSEHDILDGIAWSLVAD